KEPLKLLPPYGDISWAILDMKVLPIISYYLSTHRLQKYYEIPNCQIIHMLPFLDYRSYLPPAGIEPWTLRTCPDALVH
ncbi:5446_t:CDS:1, partial [Acaulospora morrowiae]